MDAAPIVVDFPLRGEWTAYHTPAERVPSHGTDQLGQRYAFDFVRIDRERSGWRMFAGSAARHFLIGIPLEAWYGWGAPIHAPFDGSVVAASDGQEERNPVQFVRDVAVLIKNAFTVNLDRPDSLTRVLGNYVIIKQHGSDVFALMAHARCRSVRVRTGQTIGCGELVADVGHSGNSTGPHLHFHLMDSVDVVTARGLPCSFRGYETWRDGTWHRVETGVPAKRELVRRVGS